MNSAVFELLLRLKGDCPWPVIRQPQAFNADDPQNIVLADELGVVMGTSRQKPVMRAHDEWSRFSGGKWDYKANPAQLRDLWRSDILPMLSKPYGSACESLVTVGMRGDGDEPMREGTAPHLLEGIVADLRQIIAELTGKPAARTPQMWALYKEVQDYCDLGLEVPDDVLRCSRTTTGATCGARRSAAAKTARAVTAHTTTSTRQAARATTSG